MSAPAPSQLDFQQCIRGSFDETNGRLRVDAELTASIIAPPGLEVSISAVDDNIAIRNSNNGNELLINPDGSINVTSVISGSSDVNLIKIDGTAASVNNGTATAGTLRVAIASDNTPFSINAIQSGSWTVTANAGTNLNTSALALDATLVKLTQTQGSTTSGQSGPLILGAVTTAAPSYTTAQSNPLSLTTAGALRTDSSATIQPISGTITATDTKPTTGTTTSVASSASSVTLLASNANRLGGSIYNDSTQILYVKFGSTSSNSSYKIQMSPQSFYELPRPIYTGIITGIWASANGNARISEET